MSAERGFRQRWEQQCLLQEQGKVQGPWRSWAPTLSEDFDLQNLWVLCSLSCVLLFVTLWTVARQAPLSMGFFRQEYWSGLPFTPPEDFPDPARDQTWVSCIAGKFFLLLNHWGSPWVLRTANYWCFFGGGVVTWLWGSLYFSSSKTSFWVHKWYIHVVL